ncbi:rho GTPase-activating protein REN1 isoform X1 [Prunus yedoensis var. nudiflora]|uniref:Rho GTPase-activating protein REN1 isoform X1 n=1 Tax=Prunus yedoensis var. nudiflora TaxID=2094558 RepID=A0A314U8Z0_PRUYE|nr:rho GTPase-activating protein REN1 isoform X1 [Prunus yedoensis var. nudiflora]
MDNVLTSLPYFKDVIRGPDNQTLKESTKSESGWSEIPKRPLHVFPSNTSKRTKNRGDVYNCRIFGGPVLYGLCLTTTQARGGVDPCGICFCNSGIQRMTNRIAETPQGEGNAPPPPPPPGGPDRPESQPSRSGNTIFKSGPLLYIIEGNWMDILEKKMSAALKGSEVNLTLGGIDLNNSGSVVVKADKKLLTVLFPDGRDGRAFTLKAETLEDLHEWKTALENALAQAPSGGAHAMGQNGILGNEKTDSVDGSLDQSKEKKPAKSTVIGVPVLLALEDVDGAPSFLEKALRFVEEYGVKVEGILRQAADVDDVESRVREYEQGKIEFSPEEDPHIIADCVKYVLRELPSSPVPASCCNALLEAFRKSGNDRGGRINAMRTTICDTFPEPNRRLLQRILLMMQTVAAHKAVNRMSCSAVAACMAPLLLRPLLAGDCEVDNDFDMGGDGSVQLLQAAAAANHAQAIVITLLEEYDNIFGEGDLSPELYSDTDESESETEGASDEGDYYDDETDAETDDDVEIVSDGTCSESGDSGHSDLHNDKDGDGFSSGSKSLDGDDNIQAQKLSSSSLKTLQPQHDVQKNENELVSSKNNSAELANESAVVGDVSRETSSVQQPIVHGLPSIQKSSTISNGPALSTRGRSVWGRTAVSAKKNLSMESIDYTLEEEDEIQMLEITKSELENRIAEEVQGNAALQASLERQKTALHERRLALEQDVARLQEELQKERDLTAALEAGLHISGGCVPNLATVDEKTRAELHEIAQAEANVANLKKKVDDLGVQLNQQRERNHGSMADASTLSQHNWDLHAKPNAMDKKQDSEAIAPSRDESSRSKDTHTDGAEKHRSNSRSVVLPTDSFAVEPVGAAKPSAPSNSKKSGTGSEGGTTSAITKLTSRLNFLKERRSQIANEIQGRGSGQPAQNLDKSQSIQYSDKSLETTEKPEKLRKAESHSYAERGRKSESQQQHSLDRGKSESHLSVSVEKGRIVESKPFSTPRTDSRS